uniref:Somatomedin B and thrombospondin type 1 domain containing n=1 Tax=Cyprinus carpio TaxID=7962 RepID=A0A8C1SGA6_CYPCA
MMGLLSLDRSALLVVAAVFGMYQFVEGGCSGRCCQGTDFTCATTDWRMDRVYETCYCDERCLKTKDCCFDYPTECPAQPCVVSEWSHWSGCAQPCQPSFRVRRRSVERLPQNSGQACPRLEEQAGCMEYQDRQGEFCASVQGLSQYRLYFRPKCRTDVQQCNHFNVFHRQHICDPGPQKINFSKFRFICYDRALFG